MKMAGAKIADMSPEDRGRIATVYKMIRDLEGQIAVIVGTYAGMKAPKVMVTPEEEKGHPEKEVYVRVASAEGSQGGCVIYMDPPGICMPC
jgi:hypothetical protein